MPISQTTLASAEWDDNQRRELNELGLSDDQIVAANEALAAYQHGGEFETINRAAFDGDADPETQGRVDAIQAAAEASPLLSDVVVWRGERNPAQNLPEGEWGAEGMEGATWTRKGFSSTSSDKIYARQFAFHTPTGATVETGSASAQPTLFRIRAPRGTPALHLDGIGEDEILLGAGAQFRVTADHGVVDGVRRIDLEVVR